MNKIMKMAWEYLCTCLKGLCPCLNRQEKETHKEYYTFDILGGYYTVVVVVVVFIYGDIVCFVMFLSLSV